MIGVPRHYEKKERASTLSDDECAKIISLRIHEPELSAPKIAKLLGRGEKTIRLWAKEAGFPFKVGGKRSGYKTGPMSPERKDAIRRGQEAANSARRGKSA